MARPVRKILLSGESPPLRFGPSVAPKRRRRRYALPWALTLGGMSVLAAASWIICLYVFGHPEQPLPHALLLKLGQLDPPRRFTIYDVPAGQPLKPQDAYAKYRRFLSLAPPEIEALNQRLLREFVTNYRDAGTVDYISGRYRVLRVLPLGEDTFMPEGIVLRVRSTEIEDLEMVYFMPGPEASPDQFRAGDDIVLEATTAYGAVLHCLPLDAERLCLAVVPLVYGPHNTPSGQRIELHPPPSINLGAPWPATE